MFPLESKPLDRQALGREVAARVKPLLAATSAKVSLCLRDLDGKVVLDLGADDAHPSASIIKLPILMTLLEQVATGRLHLDDPLKIEPRDRVEGTGVLKNLQSVHSLTLAEMARLMIVLSDNVATNALIGLLGMESVALWCQGAGLGRTHLRRRMMDMAARAAGIDNWTSAADATAALMWPVRKEGLPPALRAFALDLLEDQRDRGHFGALLPPRVQLANKAGQLPGLRHDAGFLAAGGRTVVLAVLAHGFTEPGTAETYQEGEGAQLLARIAQEVALALIEQANPCGTPLHRQG